MHVIQNLVLVKFESKEIKTFNMHICIATDMNENLKTVYYKHIRYLYIPRYLPI